MAGRTAFYGGIVLDGLIFHIDAGKEESYNKTGIRYWQQGSGMSIIDFADESIDPSTDNATGLISGATFSNFAPYHRAGYRTLFWHDPNSSSWKNSSGVGTYFGNLEFDGINDYVSFTSTPEMTGITDLTVSAWVYVNKFTPGINPTGGTFGMIASRYSNAAPGTPANGWELFIGNDGVVNFGGREIAGALNYIYVTASTLVASSNNGGATSNGGWYNLVGTKKADTWNVYVAEPNRFIEYGGNQAGENDHFGRKIVTVQNSRHGTASSVQKGTGTIPFGNNNLFLGRNSANAIYHFNGRIMQLSVYDRALSLAEINQNFDAFSKRIEKVPEAFQQGNNPLRQYEYMIVTYVYGADGIQRDLDSATFFQGTGTVEDSKIIGCGQPNGETDTYATPISSLYQPDGSGTPANPGAAYLYQAGDDVANGKGESILINFENMIADMPASSVNNNVSVELYGGWHSNSTLAQGVSYAGNLVNIEVSTYTGGTLTNPPDAPNTIVSSGTLVQRFTYYFPVVGTFPAGGGEDGGQGCGADPVTRKTRVGTINYNLSTRVSSVTFY